MQSGHKLHSNAIKHFTRSNFSHAMIAVGDNSIIHAEKDGIFSLNPQRVLVEHVTDFKVLRFNQNLSSNELKEMEFFLRDQIGSIYSVKEAISVVTKSNRNNKYQFCSRLVAQAYVHIKHKIVDDIDFCTPAEIENSKLFYEVENIIRQAEKCDIEFASTKNFVKENQKSMYDWLNKTRYIAKKYDFDILKVNDVDIFLQKHPNEDDNICKFMVASGYLENYLIEVENNPHMHNEDIFVQKFGNIENIIYSLAKEFNNIPSHTQRAMDNYKASLLNYEQTNLNYYKLQIDLYKNILGVSLSKFITIFNAANKLIRSGNSNEELMLISLYSQEYMTMLQQLGIEKYNKNRT